MPADRFAFAIGVGRDVDVRRVLRGVLQLLDDLLARHERLVLFGEVVVDVHTQLALRQIADVAHRRDHLVVAPEIFVDGLRLRRRFDHDECFCHVLISTLARSVKPGRTAHRPRASPDPAVRARTAAAAVAPSAGRFARQSRPDRTVRRLEDCCRTGSSGAGPPPSPRGAGGRLTRHTQLFQDIVRRLDNLCTVPQKRMRRRGSGRSGRCRAPPAPRAPARARSVP